MRTIGLICGGFSSEFDISVKSGRNILKNLPSNRSSYLILLKKQGWFIEHLGNEYPFDHTTFSAEVEGARIQINLAIVYIHGNPGENGKLQAYLDMINIPYVNSGALASELSFDKWFCNQFLKGFNIPVAKSLYLRSPNELGSTGQIIQDLGLPLFVKPCDSGSSYGIAKVKAEEELEAAVNFAFQEGRTVVIEAFLDGVEVTCGVYRNAQGTQALPPTEIVTNNDFFDYEAKYNGCSEEITPARIPQDQTEALQSMARKIYDIMQLKSIARIDFMVVKGVPHLIEVNTTPGFSDASIVPKMLNCAGIPVDQFWKEIIEFEESQL